MYSTIHLGFSLSDKPFSVLHLAFSLADNPYSAIHVASSLPQKSHSVLPVSNLYHALNQPFNLTEQSLQSERAVRSETAAHFLSTKGVRDDEDNDISVLFLRLASMINDHHLCTAVLLLTPSEASYNATRVRLMPAVISLENDAFHGLLSSALVVHLQEAKY
ncbi:hypothetical protein PoB_001123500 [Plakobranchus ocellatus]|uniref:Uncharacterized protein n=1 Tax=Plakobranchus ocellatus TaxID=259542 RepID=A0AAV3YQL4_9GAST|nr:hypothetical protein PoB_001123500 [Plakobranchus ocellatus]